MLTGSNHPASYLSSSFKSYQRWVFMGHFEGYASGQCFIINSKMFLVHGVNVVQ